MQLEENVIFKNLLCYSGLIFKKYKWTSQEAVISVSDEDNKYTQYAASCSAF